MKIYSRVISTPRSHAVEVSTNGNARTIGIPPKDTGNGSSVNGAELLCLALATCYCNDLYREAARRSLAITSIQVECTALFGAEGESGSNFEYQVKVESSASDDDIRALIRHTDGVAEIQNTLRKGVPVKIVY